MKGDLVELNKHVTLSRLLFSVCFFGWEGEGEHSMSGFSRRNGMEFQDCGRRQEINKLGHYNSGGRTGWRWCPEVGEQPGHS